MFQNLSKECLERRANENTVVRIPEELISNDGSYDQTLTEGLKIEDNFTNT